MQTTALPSDPEGRGLLTILAILVIASGTFLYVLTPQSSLALVMLFAAPLLVAAVRARPTRTMRRAGIPVDAVARLVVLVQLGFLALYLFDHLESPPTRAAGWTAFLVLAVAGLDACRLEPWRHRLTIGIVCGAGLALGLVAVAEAQDQTIDVLYFQQEAAARVLVGSDPYVPGYADIYPAESSTRFFGSGLSVDGKLQFGYPYPPITLLPAIVGHLVGDVRILHVLAVVLSAGTLLAVSGASWWGRVGCVLLLTQPALLHVYAYGWTDTYVLLAFTLVLWTARRAHRLTPAAVGLLVATKQYAVIAGLAVVWRALVAKVAGPSRWRRIVEAGAAAAAVTLPWAIWHPGDFLFSVVGLHLRQPFRPDSMSLLAVSVTRWGVPSSAWFTPMLVTGTLAVATWVARRPIPGWHGALTGSALVFLTFLLLAKQAFVNYYVLLVGTLCAAVAMISSEAPARGSEATATPLGR